MERDFSGVGTRSGFAGAVLCCTALVLLLLLPAAAGADSTFTVTRDDDSTLNGCDNDCTLREAVTAANADPDASTIDLTGGHTYTLTVTGPGPDSQGDLDIVHSLSIRTVGGTGNAVINANGTLTEDRALQITGGETSLFGVNIEGGTGAAVGVSPVHHFGGGIEIDAGGALAMYDSSMFDNSVSAAGDQGGAIYNNGGRAFLLRDLLSSNKASFGFGGGVETIGSAAQTIITDSKFSRNDAFSGGALDDSGGETTVTSTQFGSNTAGEGGAIFGGFNGNGTTNVFNSTFNDNTADTKGGGLRLIGGSALLKNSTLSNNNGTYGGGLSVENPFMNPTPPSVTLEDTILAGNHDPDNSDGTDPDCVEAGGFLHSNGHNIIGIDRACGVVQTTGDQFGSPVLPVDPGLVGVNPGSNGGPSRGLTYALDPSSVAVNAGDPAADGCEFRDARDVPRSLGGQCDIGAYELVRCAGVTVNIVGTANDDNATTLLDEASDGADGYLGFAGNDQFSGLGGDDGLCGGDGKDQLFGGGGQDRIHGDAGQDDLTGEDGNDIILGGPGPDGLVGDSQISADNGEDTLLGGTGNDNLRGNTRADKLFGQDGADRLLGGTGDDLLKGGNGADRVRGEQGNDRLNGGMGADHLFGGPGGHDVCIGGPGRDTAVGCEVKLSIP